MSKSILITGASRGLGEGLARQFAARGYKLALTARNRDDLQDLATALQGQAAQVITKTLEVTDFNAITGVFEECSRELGGVDIIIANAGVGFDTPAGKGHFENIRTTINVNLTGAIATAEAAIELFRKQGRGQLVGITSVAGVRGMRGQGAYSASKAGFGKYLEALRCETTGEPIIITELAPGFIDTDMNRAVPNRPFLVDVQKGTGIMADLIERQVGFRYVPPWPWTLVAQFLKVLPDNILKKM